MEHWKLHLTDMAHVPHQSVGDAPGSAARLCCSGQQFAPRRDAIGWTVAGKDGHVTRLQIVYQPDLQLVRVLATQHRVRLGIEHHALGP